MNKAVIILSGGIDSTTLLYDILAQEYEVYALSFNYGQKHIKELKFAKMTCEKLGVPHKIIDLSDIGRELFSKSALVSDEMAVPKGNYGEDNMKTTVVPNRNMILLSIATANAITIGAKKIFYGAHTGDHAIYPDCRPEFVDAMKSAIGLADWEKVELVAPYINMDKSDIVAKGVKLGVDYSLTWSCYKGGEKPCGVCGTCLERTKAFKKAGVKDPSIS